MIGKCGVVVAVVILLAGCFAEINEDVRADNVCVDTRDGSTFSFKGKTMRNAQYSIVLQDACLDVTDDDGKDRTLCRSHESWLKCDPGFYETSTNDE